VPRWRESTVFRPRMRVSRTEQERVVARFLAALRTGDVPGLMAVLAPDVLLVADGGGLAPTVPHPVRGSKRVTTLLSAFARFAPHARVDMLLLNGTVAARIDLTGEFDTAITFAIEDGRITRIYAIRNPHKLERLSTVAQLRR
jgi:ketosteroid isomerase-like protein